MIEHRKENNQWQILWWVDGISVKDQNYVEMFENNKI